MGTADTCNLGQACYSKSHRQVQQTGKLFYGEKGKSWEGLFWKSVGEKQ